MNYQDQDIIQLLREIGIEKDMDEVTLRDVKGTLHRHDILAYMT